MIIDLVLQLGIISLAGGTQALPQMTALITL